MVASTRQALKKEPLAQRTRKGLRKIMDYFIFRYLVVIALGILALWLLLKIVIFLASTISPEHHLSLVPHDAADAKSKEAAQLISSKLRQLQSSTQPASGYGFLETPALASVPKEARKLQNLEALNNLNIKIKDVDVNALVKTVREVLSPPQYELRVRVIDLTNVVEVNCDLVYGDQNKGSWSSRKRKPDAPAAGGGNSGATAQADITDELIDDVLFQLIYDLMTEKEHEEWGVRMNEQEYQPKNWQTLQAYTRGVQSLMAYQRSLDHKDLEEALKFLKRLPVVAPENPYGLYFYGIALSEDRKEEQAVTVFEQLQRLVSVTADPAAGAAAAPQPLTGYEKMYYEAVFNEATARLKLYSKEPGDKAIKTLTSLTTTLATKKGTDGAALTDDQCYYRKLLATSHAQLAYSNGTLLSIVYKGVPEEPLQGEAKKYSDGVVAQLNLASTEFDGLAGCLTSNEVEERAQRDRERKDIEFRIKNARGYSRYRKAQYLTDDVQFKDECDEAIRELEQANLARPNHYEVLQNMAMIYDDSRFDAKGVYLDRAESLYLQTKEFVPNDYYQFERLAQIQWRRIVLAGSADAEAIKKGKDYASQALKLRPQASRARYLLAHFSVKSWENAKATQTPDAQSAAEAISNFKQAISLRPDNAEYKSAYLDFLLRYPDPGTNDAKTAYDTGNLLLEAAKNEFSANVDAKKRLLTQAVIILTRAVALSVAKDTDDKKKINEEATKLQAEATQLLSNS